MRKWISKNQGITVAIIINICLLVWAFGCESKVQSLKTDAKVTRAEFTIEYNNAIHKLQDEMHRLEETAQLSFAELDRLDEIKYKLFDALSVATAQGSVNPIGLVTLLGTVAGIGLGVDNRIKDKVIKNRPLNSVPEPNNNT